MTETAEVDAGLRQSRDTAVLDHLEVEKRARRSGESRNVQTRRRTNRTTWRRDRRWP